MKKLGKGFYIGTLCLLWFTLSRLISFEENLDKVNKKLQYPANVCPNNLLTVKMSRNNEKVVNLGDKISAYAAVWGLSHANGMIPVIPNYLKQEFSLFFKNLSIKSDFQLHIRKDCNLRYTTLNEDLKQTNNRSVTIPEDENVELQGVRFSHYLDVYNPYRSDLIREFSFKEDIMDLARDIFRAISFKYTDNELTYIGIHVRRKQYKNFAIRWIRGNLAGRKYVYNAMTVMESKFPSPVYIVLGDDMDWCKKYLNFTEFNMEFIQNDPILDLAVLSSCNHSIITHGKLGFWGAYLSQGNVIQPANFSVKLPELQKQVIEVNLQGWSMMPII